MNISLGEDCWTEVTPDMILEAPGNDCNYIVEIFDGSGASIGNIVNGNYVNQTLTVKVHLGATHCWGSIVVIDEIAPEIDCVPSLTLLCNDQNYTGDPQPIVSDNCDSDPDIVIISDNTYDLPCTNAYSAQRVITFKAVDNSGNESDICTQTINFQRASLNLVSFPSNRDDIQLPSLDCDNNSGWDANNNNYPDPEESGVPTIGNSPIYPNNTFCEIEATYSDQVINICNGMFKVLRNWSILDWCSPVVNGQNPINQIQIIKVSDNEAPFISCAPSINLGSNFGDCTGNATVPAPTLYDNCGSVSYTVSSSAGTISFNGFQYVISNAPASPFEITYTATDDCGNSSSCSSTVYISDNIPPVPICDVNTVAALGADGFATIYWQTFDDGSYDNCAIDYIKVRRNNACGYSSGWRDFVRFCCADITNSPINVEMGVWDIAGNFNSCYINVNVVDNLPPSITCPPNITISCNYPLDLWNLSAFGTVVTDPSQIQPIIINDPNYPNGYAGQDGYAYDNCNSVVSVNVVSELECGQGVIKRIFKATDDYGSSSTCVQFITVQDYDPFNYGDIDWPNDYTMNTCSGQSTDPDHTGSPALSDDNCSLVAATYEDQVFTIVPDACFKILRTWTVIDWCQFDPDNTSSVGYWSHTQTIKIKNSEAPAFANCSSQIICDDAAVNCTGLVELQTIAIDDCTPADLLIYTYNIDLNNDGSYDISGQGNQYSAYYEFGVHKVLWTVEDLCGNTETCSYEFKVEDCKKPTPVCHNGLASVIMPSTGTIDLNASVFDASSFDNCTASQDLLISYSSDPADSVNTFTCNSLGFQPVEIWVTDAAGNQDYCETYVIFQDPNGVCGGSTGTIVSGELITAEGNPVDEVNMNLSSSLPGFPVDQNTNSSNYYAFFTADSLFDQTFTLIPSKNTGLLEGVSTYDLYLMQMHILGLQPLEGPYNLIAADVNNDDKITVIDIIELRNLILGNIKQLSNNDSWNFISPLHDFTDINDPFVFSSAVEFVYNNSPYNFDFTSVKIGDVNSSINSSLLNQSDVRSEKKLNWTYNIEVKEEKSLINFFSNENIDLQSIQLALDFGQKIRVDRVIPGRLDISATNVGLLSQDDGQINLSYFRENSSQVHSGDILFSLEIENLRDEELNLKFSEKRLVSEIIDVEGTAWDIGQIQQRNDQIHELNSQFSFEVSPNPFSDHVVFQIKNSNSEHVRAIKIFDISGKLVHLLNVPVSNKDEAYRVSSSVLNGQGMFHYVVETNTGLKTGKIILIR